MRNPQKGSAILISLFAVAILGFLVWGTTGRYLQRLSAESTTWREQVARESAESAFAIMEAALERRMWEFPPDGNCLRSLSTTVTGTLPAFAGAVPGFNGVTYSVTATLDPSSSMVSMNSSATYHGQTANLQKVFHLNDAGQFLILNKSQQMSLLSAAQTTGGPASLISKDRRIQFAGIVGMFPSTGGRLGATGFSNPYPTPYTSYPPYTPPSGSPTYTITGAWSGYFTPAAYPLRMPKALGILVQSERAEFLGGLTYNVYKSGFPTTASWTPGIPTGSLDYSAGYPAIMLSYPAVSGSVGNLLLGRTMAGPQGSWNGSGFSYFTSSYTEAQSILSGYAANTLTNLQNCGTAPCANPDQWLNTKRVYPMVLFGAGNGILNDSGGYHLPIDAGTGTDDGKYLEDPKKWITLNYQNGAGEFDGVGATCVTDLGGPQCNNSNDFPNGFRAWRHDAGLDGSLYGRDGTAAAVPTISWDNMDALKDDATACGIVVDHFAYEDCDIGNQTMAGKYVTSPTTNPCMQVHKVSLDDLPSTFHNFNTQIYDPTSAYYSVPGHDYSVNQNLFLRRVVYSANPLEVEQDDEKGFWPTQGNATIRNNVSIWLISESHLILKANHPASERTSPLAGVETGRARQLYFNDDTTHLDPADKKIGYPLKNPTTSGYLPGLKLLLFSPEKPYLIPPQYVPTSFAELQNDFPVSGGVIQGRYEMTTNYNKEENNGYIYGLRDFNLNRLAMITNQFARTGEDSRFENTFQLRGYNGESIGQSGQALEQMCLWAPPLSAANETNLEADYTAYANNPTDDTLRDNALYWERFMPFNVGTDASPDLRTHTDFLDATGSDVNLPTPPVTPVKRVEITLTLSNPNLSSIASMAQPAAGSQNVVLYNKTGRTVTFRNDALGAGTGALLIDGGSDFALAANSWLLFTYDLHVDKWRICSGCSTLIDYGGGSPLGQPKASDMLVGAVWSIPPKTSNYYDKADPDHPRFYSVPFITILQQRNGLADVTSSPVRHIGLRMVIPFDSATNGAHTKQLSNPDYFYLNTWEQTVSLRETNRRAHWFGNGWMSKQSPFTGGAENLAGSTDSSTTGSNADLSLPPLEVVEVKNVGLNSIRGIEAPAVRRNLRIVNRTGNFLTLINGASPPSPIKPFSLAGDLVLNPNYQAEFFYDPADPGHAWKEIKGKVNFGVPCANANLVANGTASNFGGPLGFPGGTIPITASSSNWMNIPERYGYLKYILLSPDDQFNLLGTIQARPQPSSAVKKW